MLLLIRLGTTGTNPQGAGTGPVLAPPSAPAPTVSAPAPRPALTATAPRPR